VYKSSLFPVCKSSVNNTFSRLLVLSLPPEEIDMRILFALGIPVRGIDQCLVGLLISLLSFVSSVPTGSNVLGLINNDIEPLDIDIRTEYTVNCLSGGSIILDDENLKKSDFLLGVVTVDSTKREIPIEGHGCNQETLNMVRL
jgi:hypothetical protein